LLKSKNGLILHKSSNMFYLLLCVLSSAVVLLTFKIAERLKVNTFSAIVINYLAACLAGFFLADGELSSLLSLKTWHWIYMGGMGVLFITMFKFLGKSTQTAGVAVTSVAAKMSVVFPVLVSLYIDSNDTLSSVKLAGIILALLAVLLSVYPKNGFKNKTLLPLIIFIGIGTIDASVKVAQELFVTDTFNPLFNATIFFIALLIGIVVLSFSKEKVLHLKKPITWGVGTLLGLANFGSMYFMIAALNHVNPSTGMRLGGSVIFGINNIGVVLAGVLIGLLFFKERPSRINWVGIGISVIAILVLMRS